jgi:hypothetical protein
VASWILRWRGVPASYNDEELELVEALIAAAERHVEEPGAAHRAAAEWDTIHELKTLVDARLVEAPVVAGQTKPCLSPTMCAIRGCCGLCMRPLVDAPAEAVDEVHAAGEAAASPAGGDLFFPVESIEDLEAGRLRRDP